MNPYPTSLPKRVVTWLEKWLTTQGVTTPDVVEPLAGDGSTRQFFRVRFAKRTCILLSDPDWIFSKDYAAHQAYLASLKIPVPLFFSVDATVGTLVMEDLGDELLQFHLQRSPASRLEWLAEAVRLLAHLHGKCYPVPSHLPVAKRRFDETKYFQELSHTQEHLAEKFLGGPSWDASNKAAALAFCRKIAAFSPEVFFAPRLSHPKFTQMGRRTFLIDFQDARLGPPHYDLASLLFDAYVPISEKERAFLLLTYQKAVMPYPKLYENIEWDKFSEKMEWVAYQRVVKAAGSFASFFTKNGKKTHLPYLIPALESALLLEKRYPEMGQLLDGSIPLEKWLKQLKSQLDTQ